MTADFPGGRLNLKPHPSSAPAAVTELSVGITRPSPVQLALDYRLVGELSALRLPEPRPAVRSDGLWRHSCFEVFIGHMPASDYWEYNFSPSGAWAAYHFTAYREGMAPLLKGSPPVTRSFIGRGVFELSVLLDLAWLARAPDSDRVATRRRGGRRGSRTHIVVLGTRASGRQTRLPSSRRSGGRARLSGVNVRCPQLG